MVDTSFYPLIHSPGDVVAQMLMDSGFGTHNAKTWKIQAEYEADKPDRATTVYTTQGTDTGRAQVTGKMFGFFGVQVRVRSTSSREGYEYVNKIRDWTQITPSKMIGIVEVVGSTQTTYHYYFSNFIGIGQVISLGKETPTSDRWLHTLNTQCNFTKSEYDLLALI